MDIDLSSLLITNVRVAVAPPYVSTTERELFDPELDKAVVSVMMDVHDRDDPQRVTSVNLRETFDAGAWENRTHEQRVWMVRSVVLRVVAHEALEHFKVNGVRVFDPHEKDSGA